MPRRIKLCARIVVIDCMHCSQSPSKELDMLAPIKFDDESNPVHALRPLDGGILPDERFDGLTRLARRHFGVTLVLIMRVDGQRRWFCSCDGLAADRAFAQTPRALAFCGQAIPDDEPMTRIFSSYQTPLQTTVFMIIRLPWTTPVFVFMPDVRCGIRAVKRLALFACLIPRPANSTMPSANACEIFPGLQKQSLCAINRPPI